MDEYTITIRYACEWNIRSCNRGVIVIWFAGCKDGCTCFIYTNYSDYVLADNRVSYIYVKVRLHWDFLVRDSWLWLENSEYLKYFR